MITQPKLFPRSHVPVNLALALSSVPKEVTGTGGKPRVGLLDLDIFGPSIPKLMGLEGVGEPYLTPGESPIIDIPIDIVVARQPSSSS
jgi:Mrp family chromosome partitioning ATPase